VGWSTPAVGVEVAVAAAAAAGVEVAVAAAAAAVILLKNWRAPENRLWPVLWIADLKN